MRGGLGFRNGFRYNYGFRRFGPRFYGYGYGYWWPYYLNSWDPFWNDYPTTTASYPYYDYGYSAPYYDNSYAPAPPPTIVYQAPAPPAPEPPKPTGPVSYLIAFKDHNIKLALAYWTDKNELRYVTMDHEIKTAPLSSIDRDLSLQLNRERRVSFALPAIATAGG